MRILWSSCRAPHAGLPSSCLRACVRRATRHSLRLTRARPAGPTRRWARTKGCAEPPSRPPPAHLPRSAREATVSGRAHLAGPAAAPPSDVGGGRARRCAEPPSRPSPAHLPSARTCSLASRETTVSTQGCRKSSDGDRRRARSQRFRSLGAPAAQHGESETRLKFRAEFDAAVKALRTTEAA
jgi:hypothetical protein